MYEESLKKSYRGDRAAEAVLAPLLSKCLTAKLAKAAKQAMENPKSFAFLAPLAVRYLDAGDQSFRNATTGSTREARRAGT